MCSVIAPVLPRYFALAFSSAAGSVARGEIGFGCRDEIREFVHRSCVESKLSTAQNDNPTKKKGGGSRLPRVIAWDQAREALACSAIFVKAALSCTARSASTLRSISISAFFNPFMNTL